MGKLRAYNPYQGLYTRGGLAGRSLESKLELIERLNLHSIVCLLNKPDEDASRLPVAYFNFPMVDSHRIDKFMSRVEPAITVVRQQLRAGKNVLVHCQGGRNRTGLVVAAVIQDLLCCPADLAINWFRAARPNGLSNETFVEYLQNRAIQHVD